MQGGKFKKRASFLSSSAKLHTFSFSVERFFEVSRFASHRRPRPVNIRGLSPRHNPATFGFIAAAIIIILGRKHRGRIRGRVSFVDTEIGFPRTATVVDLAKGSWQKLSAISKPLDYPYRATQIQPPTGLPPPAR